MALPLYNSAEGQANGTVPTGGSGGNTGGSSGDYFDAVTIGTGETLVFDSAQFANGARSYRHTTDATVHAQYLQWAAQLGTLSTNQTLFVRWYYRAPSIPSSSVRMLQILNGSTVLLGVIHASGSGDVGVQAGTTTQTPQTATALTANTWYRIEGHFTGIGGGTTAGGYTLTVYQGNTQTQQGNQITGSSKNFGTLAPNTLRLGVTTANGSINSTYYFDDHAVSATSMPAIPGAGRVSKLLASQGVG